jgi:hypothetical protein
VLDYRFYSLRRGNHIAGPPEVAQCGSDQEAIAHGRKLLDGLDIETGKRRASSLG